MVGRLKHIGFFFQKVKPTKPLTELKNAYSTTHVVSTKQIHKITQYYIAKNRRYKKKKTCLHNYCAVFCLSDDNPRSKKKNWYSNSLFALIIWIQIDTDFKEHYPQVHFLFFVSIEPCPDFPNWTWTNLPSVQYFKNLLQNNI